MMKNFLSFLFALTFIGASCKTPNPTPTPLQPTDAAECASACKRMQELGCKEGDDVQGPNNTVVSCEEFCVRSIVENFVALNPTCVAGIRRCEQIETLCAVGKRR